MIEIKNDNSRNENEYNLHLKISHQNIVKYFDHFNYEDKEDDRDYICLITEYCEVSDPIDLSASIFFSFSNFFDNKNTERRLRKNAI